jgi:hypothetical protein
LLRHHLIVNSSYLKLYSGVGRDSAVGVATCCRLDGSGIECRWGAIFCAPIQSGPGTHPASCRLQWVPGLFPGSQAAGAWRWLPTRI